MHAQASAACMHTQATLRGKHSGRHIYTCTDQHKAETVSHQCGMEACSACCTGRHSSSVFSSSANPTSWSKTKQITIWLLDQMFLSLDMLPKTTATKHSNFSATITTLLWNEKSNCLPLKQKLQLSHKLQVLHDRDYISMSMKLAFKWARCCQSPKPNGLAIVIISEKRQTLYHSSVCRGQNTSVL